MQAKVHKFAGSLPSAKDLEQLQRDAPGLFDSGYFVLAAVEGAPAVAREQATFTINLLRGGTAGQIVVVPKQSPATRRTRALGDRLHEHVGRLRRTDAHAGRRRRPGGQPRRTSPRRAPRGSRPSSSRWRWPPRCCSCSRCARSSCRSSRWR